MKKKLLQTMLALTTVLAAIHANAAPAPLELLQQGKIAEATAGYESLVEQAMKNDGTASSWNTFMEAAWAFHQIGSDKRALELSNKALETAKQLRNPWAVGRSLAWLGWTYADMGLYDLAIRFYSEAISIGAPNGVITHVHVWGMSKQEMGYVFMRKGDLETAWKYIKETTDYARSGGISVGVSEGAAHLAEIALLQGRLKEAEALAQEAVAASKTCNCSPLNTARAMTMLARVQFKLSEDDPQRMKDAVDSIKEALHYAQRNGVSRFVAEGKILSSKTLPRKNFTERLAFVQDALALLQKTESEQRGVAQAEVGTVFLEGSRLELANFYLKNGLAINEQLLRKIDVAYVKSDIATLEGLRGEEKTRLATLKSAAVTAKTAHAWQKAIENEERLADELIRLGYLSIAKQWTEQAIQTANQILEHENAPATKDNFLQRKLFLTERLGEIELKLKPMVAPEPKAG